MGLDILLNSRYQGEGGLKGGPEGLSEADVRGVCWALGTKRAAGFKEVATSVSGQVDFVPLCAHGEREPAFKPMLGIKNRGTVCWVKLSLLPSLT